jgi:hypothetical protein
MQSLGLLASLYTLAAMNKSRWAYVATHGQMPKPPWFRLHRTFDYAAAACAGNY